jgi:hypothetical protein
MSEPLLESELAAYLKAQGFGDLWSDRSRNKVIFIGEEPSNPSHTITLLEDGGGPPLLTLAETRAVTIRVRNEDYMEARTEAQQIQRALHEEQGILSTIDVARVRADTNPISLGKDANGRHVFSQAFTFLVKRLQPTP